MQIVVNTRLLLNNRLEGIGWFTYQTLKRITQNNPDVHFVFLFDRAYDEEFIFSDNVTPLVLSPQARHPVLYFAWFQFSVKKLLNRMKPDLFLSPDGFLSLGAQCKQLAVIHDINFLRHPKDLRFLTGKYYNHFFPKFARAATRIATVSKYSRREIASEYHVMPDKIDVVYNGINPFFKPISEKEKDETRRKHSGGKSYFVYVGSLHPRKNIPMLLQAFAMFKKESRCDMRLVLAGPAFWGMQAIAEIIRENDLTNDVIFTGRLDNSELANVVASAFALTFVPYYEGFGIPLIEAMQCEIPVITSNVTSLPEIAGDAALLVDPMNAANISSAMNSLFNNPDLCEELVAKGKARKLEFSWDKSAELLWQSILKAIDQDR